MNNMGYKVLYSVLLANVSHLNFIETYDKVGSGVEQTCR